MELFFKRSKPKSKPPGTSQQWPSPRGVTPSWAFICSCEPMELFFKRSKPKSKPPELQALRSSCLAGQGHPRSAWALKNANAKIGPLCKNWFRDFGHLRSAVESASSPGRGAFLGLAPLVGGGGSATTARFGLRDRRRKLSVRERRALVGRGPLRRVPWSLSDFSSVQNLSPKNAPTCTSRVLAPPR